jgi:hypothetical protein
MHHATLPASFGQVLGGTLNQAATGIGNDQLHAREAAVDQARVVKGEWLPWSYRRGWMEAIMSSTTT